MFGPQFFFQLINLVLQLHRLLHIGHPFCLTGQNSRLHYIQGQGSDLVKPPGCLHGKREPFLYHLLRQFCNIVAVIAHALHIIDRIN